MLKITPMEQESLEGTLLSSLAIELVESFSVVEMSFSLSWLQFYALRCRTEFVEKIRNRNSFEV
jgi:hypothetical protein